MKRIIVVGGGIAGLAAAYRLGRLAQDHGRPLEVRLLEASGRLGGKIFTERQEELILERGPDSFITVKPEALDLARELCLADRLLTTRPGPQDVYVYSRGRLRRLPEGLLLMAPSRIGPFLRSDILSWRGKFRMGMDWILPRGAGQDEALGDFARRRFGTEAAETIVQPIMAGIYGGDVDRLSLESTFPRFVELERRYGSVIRGLRAERRPGRPAPHFGETMFMTLAGGLSELTEALAGRLGADVVRMGTTVRRLGRNSGVWQVDVEGGEKLEAHALIVTPLCWQAAELLEQVDAEIARLLRDIPVTSTATLSLSYDRARVGSLPEGYGFVVPRSEGGIVAAGTFTSQKFDGRAPEDAWLLRCFLGGAGREAALDTGDAAITGAALSDVRRVLGLDAPPQFSRIARWPRANPQYYMGHQELVQRIEALLAHRWPGLFLAGASYRGIGIPDCIASGDAAARRAFELISPRY